jgi:predicted dehydrogenase
MWAPELSLTEALRVEMHHFLECIRHDRQPLTDGLSALRVINILEAASRSLAADGQPVRLPPIDATGGLTAAR